MQYSQVSTCVGVSFQQRCRPSSCIRTEYKYLSILISFHIQSECRKKTGKKNCDSFCSLWLWLLLAIMKRCTKWCALQLYCTSLIYLHLKSKVTENIFNHQEWHQNTKTFTSYKTFTVGTSLIKGHVSSGIQEDRNGSKKKTFNEDLQILQSKQLPQNELAKKILFWHVANFCWIFLSKVWMSENGIKNGTKTLKPLFLIKHLPLLKKLKPVKNGQIWLVAVWYRFFIRQPKSKWTSHDLILIEAICPH